jgi:hypothetical protein
MMFAVRLTNGEDIQAREGDELTISQETSVVTVSRVDRFEEIATRYSPLAWQSVTQRTRERGAAFANSGDTLMPH